MNITSLFNDFKMVILDGLNLRLGTTNLDPKGLVEELVKRNDPKVTLESIIVMPEQDSWL